jgi:hypothetical protein
MFLNTLKPAPTTLVVSWSNVTTPTVLMLLRSIGGGLAHELSAIATRVSSTTADALSVAFIRAPAT